MISLVRKSKRSYDAVVQKDGWGFIEKKSTRSNSYKQEFVLVL